MRWIALVGSIVVYCSGCASPRFDRITVKATPRAVGGKYDFSVSFHSEKGLNYESD